MCFPQQVYRYPANLFVADFIGNPKINLLNATATPGAGENEFAVRFLCSPRHPGTGVGPGGGRRFDRKISHRIYSISGSHRMHGVFVLPPVPRSM